MAALIVTVPMMNQASLRYILVGLASVANGSALREVPEQVERSHESQ